MAFIEVESQDVYYQGESGSAEEQSNAFHIIATSNFVSAIDRDDMSDKALVLILMQLSAENLRKLESLLLKNKIVRQHDDVPVGKNMFVDDIAAYWLLMAKVIQANISKSFTKLSVPQASLSGQHQSENGEG